MSTPATPTVSAPKSPAPTPTLVQDIAATEKKIGIWFDPAHIILITLLIAALVTGTYLFESRRADVAEAKAEVATQVAEAAKQAAVSSAAQNAAEQEQVKTVEAALTAANQQLLTANQQLQSANAQLTSKLLTQQKTDATLPPTAQAQRWAQLVPQAQVTVTTAGFSIDPVGAIATIQDLEELPIDRERITNLDTQITNDQQEITNTQDSLALEKTAHASDLANDQKELTEANDTTKQVKAQFTAYKRKAHRNYIRAFFVGVVVGVIGGHVAGF